MKNRPNVPADQLNNPSQKDKISKVEKQKKTIIPKTLEAFNLKAIYDTMQYSH